MVEPSERPKVLVLVFSHLAEDARVLRQVRWLSQRYDVTSAAFGASPVVDVEHIELADIAPYRGRVLGRIVYIAAFLLRLFPLISRRNARDHAAADVLGGREWDVVVANDVETMPLALRLAPRFGILADVHEYATRQNEHSRYWRRVVAPYYRWLVTERLRSATAVTTVSRGIANEYAREFGIRAEVVTNASPLQDLAPTPVHSPIRLVHSGAPAVQRRLELMIEAVQLVDADVTLDLYLLDDGSDYLASLKSLASSDPRIRFREAVPADRLVEVLNRYDIGLCILPPTTFNLAWCLPNKFFDYIQARLGLIVGPSPEMQYVVEETGVGWVTDDFSAEAIARVLEELDAERIARWKASSAAHVVELSSESQGRVWDEIIGGVLEGDRSAR